MLLPWSESHEAWNRVERQCAEGHTLWRVDVLKNERIPLLLYGERILLRRCQLLELRGAIEVKRGLELDRKRAPGDATTVAASTDDATGDVGPSEEI